MADWDISDSDEEQPTKQSQQPTTKAANEWEVSDESEDEQSKQITSTTNNNADAWDASDNDDNDDNDDTNTQQLQQQNGSTTNDTSTIESSPNKIADTEKAKEDDDAAKLRKLKKKQQNYKRKQKKKNKKKKRQQQHQQQQQQRKAKPPPKTQSSIPKNQDELIEMSSDSDSSSDDNTSNKKGNKKMESYADRMATDNDILFEGHEAAKKKREERARKDRDNKRKNDDRVMLSGEVNLKSFPLGSGRDCENLADQISALLDQKLFEDEINADDIFMFYKKLLSHSVIEKLDMVNTKELTTKMNSLLTGKQKAWHKKKNPTGKKKKKPQWIVAGKFNQQQTKKTGHVDGGYDETEYSLFD